MLERGERLTCLHELLPAVPKSVVLLRFLVEELFSLPVAGTGGKYVQQVHPEGVADARLGSTRSVGGVAQGAREVGQGLEFRFGQGPGRKG